MELNPQTKIKDLLQAGQEAINNLDSVAAATVASDLQKIMSTMQSGLPSQIKDQCDKIYTQLLFVQLHALSPDRVLRLVNDHLAEGLDITDYNLTDKVLDLLDFIQIPEERLAFAQNLIGVLEHSQSEVGSDSIILDGRNVRPQIGMWVRDYNNFPSAQANRSSIEQLNYLDTSENPKRLNAAQRTQLLAVFGLYDELRSALAEVGQMDDVDNDDDALDVHEWLSELPGITVDEEDSAPLPPIHPSQKPEVIAPAPAPVPQAQISPLPPRAQIPQRFVPPAQTPQVLRPAPKPLNMQDMMINRGPATTKVDYAPPQRPRPAVQPQPETKDEDIDSKLEALKKRTQDKQ